MMYTETELLKICRHFYHMKHGRLFALIRHSCDKNATNNTLSTLKRCSVNSMYVKKIQESLADLEYHCGTKMSCLTGRNLWT